MSDPGVELHSDLGNVTCQVWDVSRPRYVCSPWHTGMNVSMIALGLLVAAGAVLLRRYRFLVVAAVGFILAGLWPADVNENVHVLGALLIMGVGNIGLLVLAFRRREPRRAFAALAAGTGLAGTCLFLSGHGLGLGVGGMERVAAFPLLVWIVVTGVVTLRRR